MTQPFQKATSVEGDYERGYAAAKEQDRAMLDWAKQHIAAVEAQNLQLREAVEFAHAEGFDVIKRLNDAAEAAGMMYGQRDAVNAAVAEIERLRAALHDAREYVAHMVERTGEVWAVNRLAKIDAALGETVPAKSE